MIRNFILKHEQGVHRFLEILPGMVSWNLILFPYWGVFVVPLAAAYFVLLFDIYWFYQSLTVALTATIAHFRVEAAKKFDWRREIESFPDWRRVKHAILIPTYKEPIHVLRRTLHSIEQQDLPKEQLFVVLSLEEKEEVQDREEKAKALKQEFVKLLPNFFILTHKLVSGEVAGKASNERFAAIWFKKEIIQKRKLDVKYAVVTSCDADHTFHPKHFSALTFKFLDDPERYYKIWQPAVLFYNNIWRLPAITRVLNTLASIYNLSQLPRKDRLINIQNYALSFWLLEYSGYWDPDIIPEDYHIFFKSFYKTRGKTEVEAVYLPIFADAPQARTFLGTIKSQYLQYQRWAWGVSDDPYVIKSYFLVPGISFVSKTLRLIELVRQHFLWPVWWVIITLGLTIPSLINPAFARTVIGYTLPQLSSFVLTLALGFLVIMLLIDAQHRPPRPEEFPRWRAILQPLEFFLMPIAGFLFSFLPGLDAHTRLMLGKYLEYRVTEKV